MHWPDVLMPLLRREDLTPDLVGAAMATILDGNATDAQIAAFAVALRGQGRDARGARRARAHDAALRRPRRVAPEAEAGPLVDTCGTGGDRSHTFNISTVAALVVAGAGVRVAKHGNRAASSQCGSADVLEELGVVIDLDAVGVARCIDEAGIGFCFAQKFHPAMRFAGPMRSQIGVPTTFNFLGPLANPARVRRQMVGVGDPAMAERVAATLVELGSIRAMVFFGHDGLDELTTVDSSTVLTVEDGAVGRQVLDPVELGLGRATPGGPPRRRRGCTTPRSSAHDPRRRDADRRRDVVLLNAASALQVAGTADVVGLRHRGGGGGDRQRAGCRGARPVDRGVERRTCGSALMGVALQCPECGFKHRLDAVGDRDVFPCAQCARELKVPAAYRTGAASANGTDETVRRAPAGGPRAAPRPRPKHQVGRGADATAGADPPVGRGLRPRRPDRPLPREGHGVRGR